MVVKTLEEKPADATHWSTRSMAQAMGISQTSISKIWRTFGLLAHRSDSFKLSSNPQFVEKLRDVVGLYVAPPERAVVLCTDEKSQIRALSRFQPIRPMMPRIPEHRSHDYVRHDTTSLFAALGMASGKVIGSLHGRQWARELEKFLERIDHEVPDALDVHLVLDDCATNEAPDVMRQRLRHLRFHWHVARPRAQGSTSSNAGSPSSGPRRAGVVPTRACAPSSATFAAGSPGGTKTPSPTCG